MPKMREKEDHHVGSLHGRDLLLCFIMVIMDMLVSSNDLLNTEDKQTIYTVSVLVIAGAVSEWLGVWMDGADSAPVSYTHLTPEMRSEAEDAAE